MKHRFLIPLFVLLATGCTTHDIEPEFPVDVTSNQSQNVVDNQIISERYLSAEEAGDIASAFMSMLDNNEEKSRGEVARTVSDISLLDTHHISRTSAIDTTFYLVNFENGGFSLIAADREIDNKIYVYSPTGEFDAEDNPGVKIYLENAIATMADAPRRSDAIYQKTNISRAPSDPGPPSGIGGEEVINGVLYKYYPKDVHDIKGPLLKTHWEQGEPYNSQCPIYNNKHAKVGCVAIAMGQICSYHKWPQNMSDHTYNWDDMLKKSSHSYVSDIGLYDIAHLLHNIGLLVNMKYGTTASGAYDFYAEIGFKEMGYNNAELASFSLSKCIFSINYEGPVYLRGTGYRGGHAWVVDGYDNFSTAYDYFNADTGEYAFTRNNSVIYTYLHFNLGWGGKSDAYYLCDGTNNGESGQYKNFSTFEFNSDNQIISGIKR